MDEPIATTSKKTVRTRKAVVQTTSVSNTVPNTSSTISPQSVVTSISTFEDLIVKISQNKSEFDALQRQIEETRQEWVKEQKQHEIEITQRNTQEDLERKREQEVKAEKDLLNMRIANLETENSRLNKELEVLKRSLEETTRQVKEIAVKVIESGSNQTKPQTTVE